jgi:DNA invertase Pin-like site-specific DNA recombinase
MKAVLLARVSSLEQEDGKSLSAQLENAQKYTQKQNLEIIDTYKLVESSTRGGRKKFKEMMNFVKRHNETIAIICDAVDRFQRDFKETLDFDPLIRAGKIELHFVSQGLVIRKESSSYELMQWDMIVMMAKGFIHQLRANTKRGLMKKLQDGEIATKAPIGYKNVADPINPNKRTVIIDESRAYIVEKLFRDYATGLYPLEEIARKAKEYGLKSHSGTYPKRNHIHRMIMNTFYIGQMQYGNEIYPHNYPTIIDKEIFDKCQKVRKKLVKVHPKYASKPFIFRGLIKCSTCGCSISSYIKKGKYIYLFCTHYHNNCKQIAVKEEVILAQIEEAIQNIVIPEKHYPIILENIKKYERLENKSNTNTCESMQSEIGRIDRKLKELLNMRLENELTPDEYSVKHAELLKIKGELETKINAANASPKTFNYSMETIVKMAKNILKIFKSSKVEQKTRIINLILWNLTLNGKRIDFSYRKPFDVLVNGGFVSLGVAGGT